MVVKAIIPMGYKVRVREKFNSKISPSVRNYKRKQSTDNVYLAKSVDYLWNMDICSYHAA